MQSTKCQALNSKALRKEMIRYMRNQFDKELAVLNTELIEMGSYIETAIESAVDALIAQDTDKAEEVLQIEEEINRKEHEIESRCLRLLLQQQPVAKDLRLISSALKMITDMERIGDQACDIAEITLRIGNVGKLDFEKLDHISAMAKATIHMVREAIDAFVARDIAQANSVIAYDDEVDSLFEAVRDDLIGMIRSNEIGGEQVVDLMMISKYFERIGDHAVNIAEWVVFSITGQHAKMGMQC